MARLCVIFDNLWRNFLPEIPIKPGTVFAQGIPLLNNNTHVHSTTHVFYSSPTQVFYSCLLLMSTLLCFEWDEYNEHHVRVLCAW